MTEDISELYKLGMDVLLTAAVIVGILTLYSVTGKLSTALSEQEATNKELLQYREFNQYDFKHVYPQDIVSVILQYRGEPKVSVKQSNGTWVTWNLNSSESMFRVDYINARVNQSAIYDSTVKYDANGAVSDILFEVHKAGCGR